MTAQRSTVKSTRKVGVEGELAKITVPDTMAALLRFESGASGTIEASWMAAGHKHTIEAEVFGTRGSISVDFERLNELRLYSPDQQRGREGFTTVLAGPAHGDFGSFIPAPGHQLGFNDLKTIEIRDLLVGLDPAKPPPWPDFEEAWQVQRTVDAIVQSTTNGSWIALNDV